MKKLIKKYLVATCNYFLCILPFQLFSAAISAAKLIVAIFLIVIHLGAGLAAT